MTDESTDECVDGERRKFDAFISNKSKSPTFYGACGKYRHLKENKRKMRSMKNLQISTEMYS